MFKIKIRKPRKDRRRLGRFLPIVFGAVFFSGFAFGQFLNRNDPKPAY